MSETHLLKRIVRVIVIAAVLQIGLAAVAHFAPAFTHLTTLGMWIVAVGTVFAVWQAAKKRSGEDRRNGERRDSESESEPESLSDPAEVAARSGRSRQI